jgi:hypothetical protein
MGKKRVRNSANSSNSIIKHFEGKNAQGDLKNLPWTQKKKIDIKALKESEKKNIIRKSGKL